MHQTVEEEVKVAVRAQRVRGAGIRIELQTTKWTAEGVPNQRIFLVGYDVKTYVSCRRCDGISLRA